MSNNFWKPVAKLTYADVADLKESGVRETTFLDYKRFNQKALPMLNEKLAEILAAFANSGGGRLVFGAVEEGEQIVDFEGVPVGKDRAVKASIRNAAHSVQPPVDIEVVGIPMPQTGDLLYVVEVRPGQRGPFQFNGRYVLRAGDGVAPMPHTSVVNAVQAAQPVARLDGGYVEVRLDRPVLMGDASDKWSCGVILSPTYDDRRALYDPFSPETMEIQELLIGRNYEVTRQSRKLKARHKSGGWVLELWPLGHVKVSDRLDTSSPTHMDMLIYHWGRFIGDGAACLNILAPMMKVDVELWIWTFDGTSKIVEWKDGLRTVTEALTKNPSPRVDPLHVVADLAAGQDGPRDRYASTEQIAATAAEYVKLFIAEQNST